MFGLLHAVRQIARLACAEICSQLSVQVPVRLEYPERRAELIIWWTNGDSWRMSRKLKVYVVATRPSSNCKGRLLTFRQDTITRIRDY